MEQQNKESKKTGTAAAKLDVVGSCSEIATKRKLRIYVNEECGNKARKEIEYTLNGILIKKKLCMVHFKSVTSWLDRIKVSYRCL